MYKKLAVKLSLLAILICVAVRRDALADDANVGDKIPGTYSVEGSNNNGTAYDGFAVISKDGDKFVVKWTVGTAKYRGIGKLVGKTLTVDWGQEYAVIYQVLPDGRLDGKWDNGKATETMTP